MSIADGGRAASTPAARSLGELQDEIISSAKRGYPILAAGAAFFFCVAALEQALPERTIGLVWIFGMMVIFPAGVLLGWLLKVQVITTGNPLGTLGGLVAGTQAFFIPVFVVVYQFVPQYLPFAVGLLGGAHFLPYVWIYRSKAYMFVSLGTAVSALLIGTALVSLAYTLVPLSIAVVFGVGVLWILFENRSSDRILATRRGFNGLHKEASIQ